MNAFSLENQVLYNSKICPANKKNHTKVDSKKKKSTNQYMIQLI